MELFWNTIANYNSSTWLVQAIITIMGIFITSWLFYKPGKMSILAMKGYLIFLNSWIAIVYYLIYCDPRNYNQVMALFWGTLALLWTYDLITGYTTFERSYKYDRLAFFLYLMPFLYPAISLARGLTFPAMTSPIMPCSVAAFTIGLMLTYSKKVNLFIILFLSHWAFIAFSKVYFFQIPEDLLLASCTVPAIYLFFKEYIGDNLHIDTKPKAKIINWLLLLLCIVIGCFLTFTIFYELFH
ncbi:MAG: hypothetical protein KBD97_03670 [Bacteroidaceae bacterium]|nr:hypothetical protein [Bacteroidaceae bacterium]